MLSLQIRICHTDNLSIALCIKGTYIKNKDKRSHNPSYPNIVFLNCSLSPMIKQIKKTSDRINAIISTNPQIALSCLNDIIPFNKGKNNNVINPIAALTPCIFEAVVIMSFVSFTLKIPEISPAPTAKKQSKRTSKQTK